MTSKTAGYSKAEITRIQADKEFWMALAHNGWQLMGWSDRKVATFVKRGRRPVEITEGALECLGSGRAPQSLLPLLDKIEKHANLAHRAFVRYSQQPATGTGRKALDRFEHHDRLFDASVSKLRALLTPPLPPP